LHLVACAFLVRLPCHVAARQRRLGVGILLHQVCRGQFGILILPPSGKIGSGFP
jgi:hypothetical protein